MSVKANGMWSQYSEIYMMHFLFTNLLRIKVLYMFRASQAALGILRACYVSWLPRAAN
jgi:hypothetical protein